MLHSFQVFQVTNTTLGFTRQVMRKEIFVSQEDAEHYIKLELNRLKATDIQHLKQGTLKYKEHNLEYMNYWDMVAYSREGYDSIYTIIPTPVYKYKL